MPFPPIRARGRRTFQGNSPDTPPINEKNSLRATRYLYVKTNTKSIEKNKNQFPTASRCRKLKSNTRYTQKRSSKNCSPSETFSSFSFARAARVAGRNFSDHEVWTETLYRIHRRSQKVFTSPTELLAVFRFYANRVCRDLKRAVHQWRGVDWDAVEVAVTNAKNEFAHWQEEEAAVVGREICKERLAALIGRLTPKSRTLAIELVRHDFFKRTGTIDQSAAATHLGVNQATVSRGWSKLRQEIAHEAIDLA